MKHKLKVLTIVSMFLISALAFVPASFAVTPETGWVHYFTTSDSTCTSTVWPTVAQDGAVGYPNNVGGPQNTAVVNFGQTICIKIELNHISYNPSLGTTLYGQVQAQSSISSSTTNSTGGVDITIIWTNNNQNPGSCTVPIFVGTSSPPNVGSDKEDVGHLIYGNGGSECTSTTATSSTTSSSTTTSGSTTTSTVTTSSSTTPPSSVPEFPVGALGMIIVIAAMLPMMLLLRKVSLPNLKALVSKRSN